MAANTSRRVKTAIVILAVLLAISLCALAATLVYRHVAWQSSANATVTIPDNWITPDAPETSDDADTAATAPPKTAPTSGDAAADTPPLRSTGSAAVSTAPAERVAGTVSLYARHPDDNQSITFPQMVPGDTITKNFCVQVSYQGHVTVHYKATLREGNRELLRALNVRIHLLSDDRVLYDGPIADMPESVIYDLSSAAPTETELVYQIMAYIPTTVGNEYQSMAVVADFSWWAEEVEALRPPLATGDNRAVVGWAVLAAVSGGACVLLLCRRRRREEESHG